MAFGIFIRTNFGRQLDAKHYAGKGLHFSRLALGDGDIGTSSVYDITTLKSEKLSLKIDAVSIMKDEAIVTAALLSTLVETGFNLKEMGLMATDPDTNEEGIYSYNSDTSAGEYVPDKNSSSKLSEYLRVHCTMEDTKNITFDASGNPLWITRDELVTEVVNQINSKSGVAGGFALFDTLKNFMDTQGKPGGLALYDSSIQSATINGIAVPKQGTQLQFPPYPVVPNSLPANGGTAAYAHYSSNAVALSSPGLRNVIALPKDTAIPAGFPDGTVILRYAP